LADTVADLLRRRCLNHLGLARRAGLVAAGAEKVRAQITSGRTEALIEAADGSLPERRKLTGLAPDVPVIDVFMSVELGAALGREAVVHVGLARADLTRRILNDATRYRGMMPSHS
jgi:ribosomal protein L7Ae-like RNA K-turn-binding protein